METYHAKSPQVVCCDRNHIICHSLQASNSDASAEKSFEVLQRIIELSEPDSEHARYHGAWLEIKVACLAPYSLRCVPANEQRSQCSEI
jgi:hypothetical protein